MHLTVQLSPSALSDLVAAHSAELDRSRPSYVVAHPHLRRFYREVQCAMFGVCSDTGLDTQSPAMLAAINATLGTAFTSRTQLTPVEMLTFSLAVSTGVWRRGWVMA